MLLNNLLRRGESQKHQPMIHRTVRAEGHAAARNVGGCELLRLRWERCQRADQRVPLARDQPTVGGELAHRRHQRRMEILRAPASDARLQKRPCPRLARRRRAGQASADAEVCEGAAAKIPVGRHLPCQQVPEGVAAQGHLCGKCVCDAQGIRQRENLVSGALLLQDLNDLGPDALVARRLPRQLREEGRHGGQPRGPVGLQRPLNEGLHQVAVHGDHRQTSSMHGQVHAPVGH
mmetsp:Transcript_13847/g.48869  ORF Transcript_13847/g.48869 Transcript_13847/m.48869 type:complete len:234 (-) Transcript_13847:882-1583(-)